MARLERRHIPTAAELERDKRKRKAMRQPERPIDYRKKALEIAPEVLELEKERGRCLHIMCDKKGAHMKIQFPLWQYWRWNGIRRGISRGGGVREQVLPQTWGESTKNAGRALGRALIGRGAIDSDKAMAFMWYKGWLDGRVGKNGIEKRIATVLEKHFGFTENGDVQKRDEARNVLQGLRLVEPTGFRKYEEGYRRRADVLRDTAGKVGLEIATIEAAKKAFKVWWNTGAPKAWISGERVGTRRRYFLISNDATEEDIRTAIEEAIHKQRKVDEDQAQKERDRAERRALKKAQGKEAHPDDRLLDTVVKSWRNRRDSRRAETGDSSSGAVVEAVSEPIREEASRQKETVPNVPPREKAAPVVTPEIAAVSADKQRQNREQRERNQRQRNQGGGGKPGQGNRGKGKKVQGGPANQLKAQS